MAVHLTRIYTKTGDDGTTALGDMSRVPKTDPAGRRLRRLRRDELGHRRRSGPGRAARPRSRPCCGIGPERPVRRRGRLLHPGHARPEVPTAAGHRRLRHRASRAGATSSTPAWPSSTASSCPAGRAGAALLHQARTIARRAERSAWALQAAEPERTNREALLYLNRLSDLLFILARVANPDGDVKWQPGGRTGLDCRSGNISKERAHESFRCGSIPDQTRSGR